MNVDVSIDTHSPHTFPPYAGLMLGNRGKITWGEPTWNLWELHGISAALHLLWYSNIVYNEIFGKEINVSAVKYG